MFGCGASKTCKERTATSNPIIGREEAAKRNPDLQNAPSRCW